MDSPIMIDGSKFEDFFTLLRSSIAFSSLILKPIVIEKILLNGKFPGLNANHVALIDSFAVATNASVAGNGVGSTILQFTPKTPFSGKRISIDFSSSTGVSLPFYSFLIPALLSKEKTSITLTGATHISKNPTTTFLRETILKYLTPYFDSFSFNVPMVGFYPKGEGSLSCNFTGKFSLGDSSRPLIVTQRPKLVALRGDFISSAERVDSDVLRNLTSLISLSLRFLKVPLVLQPSYVSSKSSGVSLSLVALFGDDEGFDSSRPFTIAFEKTWDSLSSIDKSVLEDDCVSFVNDFISLLNKNEIDVLTSELLIPFIAVLGGSIYVKELTDKMKSVIYASKEILDLDFILEEGVLLTEGYLNSFVDSLPSIDDI